MVDLVSQHGQIRDEVETAVLKILRKANYIQGEEVLKFEEDLASYMSVSHVISCASGTDALQIALMALPLQPGDEVITTPFSFVAAVEVIALLGLKPVFVDVDADTFNLNVEQIEEKITSRTRVILPVHLFGQCAAMEPLMAIAKKYDLYVVEDVCQAIGAESCWQHGVTHLAGTMGVIGCLSFFPSKVLGCYGDGGALITSDDTLAQKMRQIARHGAQEKYHHKCIGINSRLDTIQAVILSIKLKHLNNYISQRRKVADIYDANLQQLKDLKLPYRSSNSTHTFHQYTIQISASKRNFLQQELQKNGIASAVYYPIPLHLQLAYQYLGYRQGDFPVAEKLSQTVLSLPIYPELTEKQQMYICEILCNC